MRKLIFLPPKTIAMLLLAAAFPHGFPWREGTERLNLTLALTITTSGAMCRQEAADVLV